MSIIKSIKQVLGLGPAAENHFWESTPNQLSLKRGTPEAPGAELIKALNGVLSFPNQGQSLTPNGYVKLPGGLIVQWGSAPFTSGTTINITFPIPFTAEMLSASCMFAALSANGMTEQITNVSASAMSVNIAGPAGSGALKWIAIGY